MSVFVNIILSNLISRLMMSLFFNSWALIGTVLIDTSLNDVMILKSNQFYLSMGGNVCEKSFESFTAIFNSPAQTYRKSSCTTLCTCIGVGISVNEMVKLYVKVFM